MLWQDLNAETVDLNRRLFESIPSYIWRVFNSDIFSVRNCIGIDEMVSCKQQHMNDKIKTHKSTYYFSLATGNRNKQIEKARDVFSEPSKQMASTCGFDLDARQNLKYRNSLQRLKRRTKNSQISTFDRLMSNIKIIGDPMSISNKTQYETRLDINLMVDHFDSRLCEDKNNLLSVDFALRDHLDDTDYLVSRWC